MASVITTGSSLDIYRKLLLCRRAEEAIVRHYPENDMKTPMHMSMGQEAVAVGVCHALGDRGQVYTSYRSHAAYLARTGDAEGFFAELYGRRSGPSQGRAGSMHLSDPSKGHVVSSAIVASVIPVAVGAAYALKVQKTNHIACVFFGDGAMEEGVFYESLNVASLMRLPVLFVLEDNDYAVHTPKTVRHAFRSVRGLVEQFGMMYLTDDSNDANTICRLATEAIQSIDSGRGPAFLDIKCYRYLDHIGIEPDFHIGYRSEDEYQIWSGKDSVMQARTHASAAGHSDADLDTLERAIVDRIAQAVTAAKTALPPDSVSLRRGVFHEIA